MFVIGLSGLLLWFPGFFGSFMPGWVFNVATIIHGEEAFLAAVFLFTVHFFNCHFRPEKFPVDVVMFTGCMPLEEFKHERKVEYDRLVKEGELGKYLAVEYSFRMPIEALKTRVPCYYFLAFSKITEADLHLITGLTYRL